MTGPVVVHGAKAGQVLEVRIKSIALHYDWGYNAIRRSPARCPTTSPQAASFIFRSTARE
jgi:acetamidase/formamidase